jgi:twinkle protein
VETAEEIPVAGLIRLADVKPLDVKNLSKTLSGITDLDRAIGGFIDGELSVWTGKRGEGKSTVLGQICVEAIDQNKKVCAYSGELKAEWFQYWIDLQSAGSENVTEYRDETGKTQYVVSSEHRKLIHEWYRDLFWIYDNEITNDDGNEDVTILKVFQYALKRYDCKVFLVDNLMTANSDASTTEDYYRKKAV